MDKRFQDRIDANKEIEIPEIEVEPGGELDLLLKDLNKKLKREEEIRNNDKIISLKDYKIRKNKI